MTDQPTAPAQPAPPPTVTIEDVLAALALAPCHVTGMHTPDHHLDHTCTLQKAAAFDRLLAALGMDVDDLPHRLHAEDCYWCHHVPEQEQHRERLRQSWAWAGVPLTDELAHPAPDAKAVR